MIKEKSYGIKGRVMRDKRGSLGNREIIIEEKGIIMEDKEDSHSSKDELTYKTKRRYLH